MGGPVQKVEESNNVSAALPETDAVGPTLLATPEPLVSIDITAELRWFFDGALPAAVRSWFTGARGNGLTEYRCDSYRHDEFVDVGLKRRSGSTLELKERLAPPELVGRGRAAGRLETWQRWSPADHRVAVAADDVWVDVGKTIIKRRFDHDGHEVPLSEETRAMAGLGCDAEIVGLSVWGRAAWSFAFAAYGPAADRHQCLLDTWGTIGIPTLPGVDFSRAVPFGYPEWLLSLANATLGPDRSHVTSGPHALL